MATILVIDDEPDNVELMTRRLTRRGFEVLGATSAADGIALATERHPDLILVDITMPLMDGYEATTRLKAGDATKAIPIIALTARAMAEDRERALAAGANEYESKPIDFPRLLEKITACLEAKP